MDHAAVEVSGNSLTVNFKVPYIGDPLCWVSFEDEWLHHRIDTFALGVRVFIADTAGQDRSWSTVNSHVQIVCHGSGVETVETGSFGMPSQLIVPNAVGDLEKPFQITGLYCHWDGTRFDNCPAGHSWGGVANMAPNNAVNDPGRPEKLNVPFQVPFHGDPFCVVSFENVWLHLRTNAAEGEIVIFIADETGAAKPWLEVNSWMQILCYGTSTLPSSASIADSSFGQMPAGAIVPSAPVDLMQSYMFSGFYCHWNGVVGQLDDCPCKHSWDGVANFDVDSVTTTTTTTQARNSLRISFNAPYVGDPFCRVAFENVWLHYQLDSGPGYVNVKIKDTDGNDVDWSTVTSWVQVMCQGAAPDSACPPVPECTRLQQTLVDRCISDCSRCGPELHSGRNYVGMVNDQGACNLISGVHTGQDAGRTMETVCRHEAVTMASATCSGVADETDAGTPFDTLVGAGIEPAGGGNHDILIIMDGVTPAVGTQDSSQQYDSYVGGGGYETESIGYTFVEAKTIDTLVLTEGKHFGDGGWWEVGPVVEVDVEGSWMGVQGLRVSPNFPADSDHSSDTSFESFVFTFDAVTTRGIRLSGSVGGDDHFMSVAEIRVGCGLHAPAGTPASPPLPRATCAAVSDETTGGTPFDTLTLEGLLPRGGGNTDISIIMDGITPPMGTTDSSEQYDSYIGGGGYETESIGYTFVRAITLDTVVLTEGKHFWDGGWWTTGPVVEVDIDGVWTAAQGVRVSPTSPANTDHDFAGTYDERLDVTSYETFVFTFDAVTTTGVRLSGTCGGQDHFTSVAELRVGCGITAPPPRPKPTPPPQCDYTQPDAYPISAQVGCQCDCMGSVVDECGDCGGTGIPLGACECPVTGLEPEQCRCGGMPPDTCGMCDPQQQGPAEGQTCAFADNLRSAVIIPQASADLNKAMQLSGLYCHWSADSFDDCPDSHVWDGVANYAMDEIVVEGSSLTIPFVESYQVKLLSPLSLFSFNFSE